jgi:hypothetical protein
LLKKIKCMKIKRNIGACQGRSSLYVCNAGVSARRNLTPPHSKFSPLKKNHHPGGGGGGAKFVPPFFIYFYPNKCTNKFYPRAPEKERRKKKEKYQC